MAKKITIESILTRLKKEFLTELNKEINQVQRAKFNRSLLVYSYSTGSISKSLKIDVEDDSKIKKDVLIKKFKTWMNEALLKGIQGSQVKLEKSRDEVVKAAEVELFGRYGKKSLDNKTPRVWKSAAQLWYFNPNTQNQKNSFRDTILSRAKAHVERVSRTNPDPDYLLFYSWLGALHLGHTFGLKAYQISRAFSRPKKGTISSAAKSGSLSLRLSKAEAKVLGPELESVITEELTRAILIDIDVDVEKDINPKKDGAVLRKNTSMIIQGVATELGADNTRTGAQAKGKVTSLVTKVFNKILLDFEKGISASEIAKNLRTSKTIEESIVKNVEDSFSGKKPKRYKSKKQKRTTVRKKVKNRINVEKANIATKLEIGLADNDLNAKLPYLNARLHDKIKQNMGKGGSKQILNYRTGRFAKSAQIEGFYPTKEKRAINATVKYMQYPYGTFEPRGRLHKPGRDPHRIFGRSIRQLLQEEKIATLRRVKVELRG